MCSDSSITSPSRPARLSLVARAFKWRRRNPVAFLAAVAGLVVLTAAIGAGLWHNHRLAGEFADKEKLHEVAFQRETLLRQEQYYTEIRRAWQLHREGKTSEVRKLLAAFEPKPDEPDVTGFEWHYLRHLSRPALRTFSGHEDLVLNCDISPDAWPGVKYVASVDSVGGLRVWELLSGRLAFCFNYSQMELSQVRFSPNGEWLATGGVDRTVHLWKVGTWEAVATLRGQQDGSVCSLAWSPDSRHIAVASRFDENVVIWKVANRSVRAKLRHDGPVRAMVFAPSGQLLLTADDKRAIRLWDTKKWTELGALPWDEESSILSLAISPDSELVVAGGRGQNRVYRLSDRRELVAQKLSAEVWSLECLTNELVAIGLGNGQVQIWRYAREQDAFKLQHQRFVGEGGRVRRIALADRGRIVVTALEEDRAVTVWDGASIHGRTSANFQWPDGYWYKHGLVLSYKDRHSWIYEAQAATKSRCSPSGITPVRSASIRPPRT